MTNTKIESNNIACVHILNPTSLAKSDAFQWLVTDADLVSVDIIIVVEHWFKAKHFQRTGMYMFREKKNKCKGDGICVCKAWTSI